MCVSEKFCKQFNEYGLTACEGCSRRDPPLYTDKETEAAVRLAMNDNPKKPLRIYSWPYVAAFDKYAVRYMNRFGEDQLVSLEGEFIRSCLRAIARGVNSWT